MRIDTDWSYLESPRQPWNYIRAIYGRVSRSKPEVPTRLRFGFGLDQVQFPKVDVGAISEKRFRRILHQGPIGRNPVSSRSSNRPNFWFDPLREIKTKRQTTKGARWWSVAGLLRPMKRHLTQGWSIIGIQLPR